jgi:uncharacterized protein YhaN
MKGPRVNTYDVEAMIREHAHSERAAMYRLEAKLLELEGRCDRLEAHVSTVVDELRPLLHELAGLPRVLGRLEGRSV